jgi:hypothetical protein
MGSFNFSDDRSKVRMSTLAILFNRILEILAQAIRQEKEKVSK